jgi:hypothetical protein
MNRLLWAAPVFAALAAAASAAELLTIEQAEARSKETGRPILAMGGSKT